MYDSLSIIGKRLIDAEQLAWMVSQSPLYKVIEIKILVDSVLGLEEEIEEDEE